MMLIMLTPSLACAMPVCADEAQAAATEQPCAGHSGHHDSGKKADTGKGKVNLLKDCMGLDLQVADAPVLKKADTGPSLSFIIISDTSALSIRASRDTGGIRGPPPDGLFLSQTQPSIILITQRFLI